MDDYTITLADWRRQSDRAALGKVRTRLFVNQLGVAFEQEWDGQDADAHHFLARLADGTPIGTLRLNASRRIDRLAVLAPWRRQGVASALLARALESARLVGIPAITVELDKRFIPLFTRQGFEPSGPPSLEGAVIRRPFIHRLHKAQADTPATTDSEHRLGQTHNPIQLTQQAQHASLALSLVEQAQRHIYLFAPSLDEAVFDTPEFVEQCARLARSNPPRTHVACVFHTTRDAAQRGSPLLDLASRLSSHVQIRNTGDHQLSHDESLLLVDNCGYLLRRGQGSYVGVADFNNALTTRRHIEFFRHTWAHATRDPYSRIHHI